MIARKCDRCGNFFIPEEKPETFLDSIKNFLGTDDVVEYEVLAVRRTLGTLKLDFCKECYQKLVDLLRGDKE